jgi:hypothetical protein
LRRRVLKSSAEREQLLQQLTQRGGQKKVVSSPLLVKNFLRRKISKAEKEARVGFETRETTDVFSFLEQSIFLHRHLRYIYLLKSFFRVVRLFARRRL